MKFSIRDLLLTITLIAVVFAAFSFSKTLGRQLLFLSLMTIGAVSGGQLFPKWDRIRTKCAIGALVGVSVYGIITHVLKNHCFVYSPRFRRITILYEPQWTIELFWFAWFAIALGASLGPLLIIRLEVHSLTDFDRTNYNMSWAVAGLMLVSYLASILESKWTVLFALFTILFVMATLPWIGVHFDLRKTATEQSDASGALRSPVKPD